jgi:hypothetical protein
MKPFKANKLFEVRWNEALGKDDCIYGYRWVFILYGFSIRVHKWLKSEPIVHHHDHAWNFLIFTLYGGYLDISDDGIDKVKTGSVRYRKAEHKHSIVLAKNTVCWSLIFTSRPFKKWGFFVNGSMRRPLQYFSRIGYIKTCRD